MTTTRGTYVISGSGYPGTGPDVSPVVVPDTQQWVFATGMPVVRLGDVTTVPDGTQVARDSLDRRVNEITVRAERFAAVVWDKCCTVAVLVDLCAGGC
jgi:hypothetical protein